MVKGDRVKLGDSVGEVLEVTDSQGPCPWTKVKFDASGIVQDIPADQLSPADVPERDSLPVHFLKTQRDRTAQRAISLIGNIEAGAARAKEHLLAGERADALYLQNVAALAALIGQHEALVEAVQVVDVMTGEGE